MSQACSCGGSNDSCYRCFGRGYYEPITTDMIATPRRFITTAARPSSARTHVFSALPGHAEKQTCPFCGARKVGIGDHIRAKHTPEAPAWQSTLQLDARAQPGTLMVRPLHDHRPHGRPALPQNARVTSVVEPSRGPRTTDSLQSGGAIDATKYWGHSFRERGGRYGSLPGHDGFDDESEP
jgi:hypothetical protein